MGFPQERGPRPVDMFGLQLYRGVVNKHGIFIDKRSAWLGLACGDGNQRKQQYPHSTQSKRDARQQPHDSSDKVFLLLLLLLIICFL